MIKEPLLINTPFPIKTERLILRPMMPGDGKILFNLVEESRDALGEWLPWVSSVKTEVDSEKNACEFYAQFILKKAFRFLIFHNDLLVGGCSLHKIDWNIPSAGIGYYCHKLHQNNGYIFEAVTALIFYGFHQLGLRRITIICDDENIKSARVAEKLGFMLESKAKGLISKPGNNELRVSRCYVRFDIKGLEKHKVAW
ncbi:acetyltransferase [endosymbiont of Acanthamoeba sp. UWC8]|uniref:GNAT family N-acetyltransferase n=1 Tax=endosymbiont of Acanthamoeba sp. UWC8 TaxID=86106 RepID=UPI0004D1DD8C|nr:GNAT family N-acetyltransferase [endosymbiont of Acanthamoeba sp. UWC8]AIF81558.1 acetyltransferase [endosymbiont of Acanthamoeba sp. UWC8]